MKKIWKAVQVALALIGALALIFHGLAWLFFDTTAWPVSMPDDAGVVASYPSPDGQYKAVLFNQNGGGGLSPYCFDFISVVPVRVTDVNAWGQDNRIFSASCNSLLYGPRGKSVVWKTERELQIGFDPTEGASGIAALILKGDAVGALIKIRYVQK